MKQALKKKGRMGSWFSENPQKARGEKFFLIYSPIWITIMAIISMSGIVKNRGDIVNIIHALVIYLPLLIVPFFLLKDSQPGKKWYETYWFKANLYIAIFSLLGNYFGSEYFFDILGMVYNYPDIKWTFDSTLVGSGQQHIPLSMYFLTVAYFMTYHTTAIVVIRRIRTSLPKAGKYLFPVLIVVIGYFWAFMETLLMANPALHENFYYKNMSSMLLLGSVFYCFYFIASFPLFYFIDEKKNESWSLPRVALSALSASMVTIFLLDLGAKIIGPIY